MTTCQLLNTNTFITNCLLIDQMSRSTICESLYIIFHVPEHQLQQIERGQTLVPYPTDLLGLTLLYYAK